MNKPIMDQVKAAKANVPAISPEDAAALLGQDNVLFVDVRDGNELAQTGKVQSAVHASRGMLEFKADPASPFHDPIFDPTKTVILYCASGGRSALAGQALLDLGYKDVRNLGGFQDWVNAGQPIDNP